MDIDPGAVEIAKLRLWLSLVVDEEDIKQIQPLPNLDYKVVCGDSLLGVEKNLFNVDLFNELEKLKPLYFNETNAKKKQEFRKQIDQLIKNLTNDKEVFDFAVYFSEVFHEKGGFDVVAANPPYISAVQHSKSDRKLRELYRSKYDLLKGAFDVYSVFLLKGVEVINRKGSYTWIIPNKFMVTHYAEDVLNHLKKRGLYSIVSVSLLGVFEHVGVYPIMIFGSSLTRVFNQYEVDCLDDLSANILRRRPSVKSHHDFNDFGIKVASGATGFQANQLTKCISETPQPKSIPFVVSGCIDPYCICFDNVRYMNKTYRRAFIRRGEGIATTKWSFWEQEKIVIAGMTKGIEAVYATGPLALGVGVYAIYNYGHFNPKFLLALLNSKYLSFYLSSKFREKHLAGGYLAINKSTIEQLPLVNVGIDGQKPFIHLVDQILAITKDEDYRSNPAKQAKAEELERQIDQLVYQLYDLTPEEIAVVEGKK